MFFSFFPVALLFLFSGPGPAAGCELKGVRISSGAGQARCVLETNGKVDFREHALSDPQRVYVDLLDSNLKRGLCFLKGLKAGGIIKAVRVAQFDPGTVRVVFEFKNTPNVSITRPSGKDDSGLVLDFSEGFSHPEDRPRVRKQKEAATQSLGNIADRVNSIKEDVLKAASGPQSAPAKERPAPDVEKSAPPAAGRDADGGHLVEKTAWKKTAEAMKAGVFPFNKWRIVIDPGHGGKDPGTSGADGYHEKQYTLEIARKLAGILSRDPHYEVFLTRDTDKFVTLDNRTLFANRVHANIFVSIHINWSSDLQTRGITTYFLNWTNDAEANRVAARENEISLKRQKQARTQLGYILASLQLEDKRDGSLRLANYIEDAVGSKVREYHPNEPALGVKNALFYVLVGDRMPAVLVEVSFLSNPRDEILLNEGSYIDEVAKGIAAGIGNYFRGEPVRALRAMAQR